MNNQFNSVNARNIYSRITKDHMLLLCIDALDKEGKSGPDPRLKVRCCVYDSARPEGGRIQEEVDAYIPIGRFLVMAHYLLCGSMHSQRQFLLANGKLNRQVAFFSHFGGTASSGPEGQCVSRRFSIVPGLGNANFAFLATSGPGAVQPDTGLIVPKTGCRPEHSIFINMPDEDITEFMLVGKMYIEQFSQLMLQQQLGIVRQYRSQHRH